MDSWAAVVLQSVHGYNVVTTGNFGNVKGTIMTNGPFQLPYKDLEVYAGKYPDCCRYENGVFRITNMEKFGKEALSGGELLSGGMEMTIRPLEGVIKDKGIVIDGKGITGKDADTGIEFSVRKLEE